MKQSCHIIEWRKRGSYSSVFSKKICKGWLQKFWVRYDREDHAKYLLTEFMHEQLGSNFCFNFLNEHILAGYGMKRKQFQKKGNKSKTAPIQKYHIYSNKPSPLISTAASGIHIV